MRLLKVMFICGAIGFLTASCSKDNEVLHCDASTVQSALLDGSKSNESGPLYYTRSLSDFKVVQQNDKSLSCSATLNLQSSLERENRLQLPVNYKVYQVNSSSDSNTSGFELSVDNQSKIDDWVKKVNLSSTLLGDYQLTPAGALYVFKKSDVDQVLYFNGSPVSPRIGNFQVNIEKNYVLGENSVFLIGSYTGGTIDADTENSHLIQIDAQGKYTVSKAFAYMSGGIIQKDDALYINGVIPGKPYIESSDLPVYLFESGVFKTIRGAESDAYYQAKYSKLQAKDIIKIALADQCYDSTDNLVDTSHACGYAQKYCFMFKSLKNPIHDQYYTALSQVCN